MSCLLVCWILPHYANIGVTIWHINCFSCNRIEQISGNRAAKACAVTVFQTCRNVYRPPVPSVTILPE